MTASYRHFIFPCEHGSIKFYPAKKGQKQEYFRMMPIKVDSICPACGCRSREVATMAEAEVCFKNLQDNLAERLEGLHHDSFPYQAGLVCDSSDTGCLAEDEIDAESEESWPDRPPKIYSAARLLRELDATEGGHKGEESPKLSHRIRSIREDLERRVESWDRTVRVGETSPEEVSKQDDSV